MLWTPLWINLNGDVAVREVNTKNKTTITKANKSQALWHTFLIPALWRQKKAVPWGWGQHDLPRNFQDGQDYTEETCLGKNKANNKQTNCKM